MVTQHIPPNWRCCMSSCNLAFNFLNCVMEHSFVERYLSGSHFLWLVLVWQPKVFLYVATFLLLAYGWFLCNNHQYCKCWFLCDNTFIFLFLATTKNRLEISIIWMHLKWWFSNVCINHSILLVLFNKVYWSMLNA